MESDSGFSKTEVMTLTVTDNNIFAGGNGIYRSTDNGDSWASMGLTNDNTPTSVIIGKYLVVTCSGGVSRSSDNGESWTAFKCDLLTSGVNCFAVSGSNLFAGTLEGVFQSSDSGATWSTLKNGCPTGVRALAFNGEELFAGEDHRQGIYLSSNSGANWMKAPGNFPSIDAFEVIGTNVIAGTDFGIFQTIDGGKSWSSLGLENSFNVSFASNGEYLFVGTLSNGVWRRPISEVLSVTPDPTDKTSSQFILEQNYPNPVAGRTTIGFSLPRSVDLSLKVFDVLGNKIATLADGHYQAGECHADWDANAMPAGIYFYQLQADGFIQTRELVIGR